MSNELERDWIGYKLIVTEPSKSSLHFNLIKYNIIPFINETGIHFWVTNYRNPKEDYIWFRVNINKKDKKITDNFLIN